MNICHLDYYAFRPLLSVCAFSFYLLRPYSRGLSKFVVYKKNNSGKIDFSQEILFCCVPLPKLLFDFQSREDSSLGIETNPFKSFLLLRPLLPLLFVKWIIRLLLLIRCYMYPTKFKK